MARVLKTTRFSGGSNGLSQIFTPYIPLLSDYNVFQISWNHQLDLPRHHGWAYINSTYLYVPKLGGLKPYGTVLKMKKSWRSIVETKISAIFCFTCEMIVVSFQGSKYSFLCGYLTHIALKRLGFLVIYGRKQNLWHRSKLFFLKLLHHGAVVAESSTSFRMSSHSSCKQP